MRASSSRRNSELVDVPQNVHVTEERAAVGGGAEAADIADAPAVPPARRKRPLAWARSNLALSALSVGVFLGIWQLAASAEWVNPLFTSSPVGIVEALVDLIRDGELSEHLIASGKLFGLGFSLSVLFALPAGILLGWYRRLSAIFDPFLQTLYVAPRIALIPVIFTWFGVGLQSQVVIVFITAFFPLLINTVAGVRAVDPALLRVARSFMARDRTIFWTLALPSALPFIISGLRLSMGMALIGVVVAEFFTGNVGLGALITTAGLSLQTDVAFVGVLVVTAFALLLNALLSRLEARVSAWKVVS